DGQAAAERLRRDEQVRLHAELLASEERARPTQARLHLVGDQQYAVRAADFLKLREELARRHDEAAFAQRRLDDYRRDRLGGDVPLEEIFQLPPRAPHLAVGVLGAEGAAVAVRVRQAVD